MSNAYEILGIPENSSEEDIKKAYKKLSLKYHPDVSQEENSLEKFKKISDAYESLINKKPFTSVENDFFRQRVAKGDNIHVSRSIDIFQVLKGGKAEILYDNFTNCKKCEGYGGKLDLCKTCNGAKFVVQNLGPIMMQFVCPSCNGIGKVVIEKCSECTNGKVPLLNKSFVFEFPPGIQSGMQFVRSGLGQECAGGVNGDLVIQFIVEDHEFFKILENGNILLEFPVTYTQLCLGSKISVPTLEGSLDLEIPAGTDSGKDFVFNNIGLPIFNNNRNHTYRGGQYVKVKLDVPQIMSDNYINILKELELENGNK